VIHAQDLRILHPELAHILADNDQPMCAASSAEAAFTPTEIELLERIVPDLPLTAQAPPLLRNLIKVARLGGYLGSSQ
jgi:hypothetical protein